MEDVMKKLYYQPVNLTDNELKNPLSVIKDFFGNHDLHEIREKSWQLYLGWVNYSSDFAEGKESADMLFFYTQLVDFINASYLHNEKIKSVL